MWAFFYKGIEFGNVRPSFSTKLPSCSDLITIHQELKTLEIMANQLGYLVILFILVCGTGMIIAVNYVTIRMHSIIPMPYYLAMPICSMVVVISVFFSLMPPASDLYDNSQTFLKDMVFLFIKNKYLSRKIKSQQPFRINVGPLFMIKRSTLTKYMECVVNMTIDAILM